jgi:hypothetical protein
MQATYLDSTDLVIYKEVQGNDSEQAVGYISFFRLTLTGN